LTWKIAEQEAIELDKKGTLENLIHEKVEDWAGQ
jgi:hypothetical protein